MAVGLGVAVGADAGVGVVGGRWGLPCRGCGDPAPRLSAAGKREPEARMPATRATAG